MRRLVPGLALAAGVALHPVPAAHAQPAEAAAARASKAEQFREGLKALQRRHGIPALSVAVYTMRGLEAAEAIGARRVGEPAPVELSDPFYIASIAKPVTATLAASLVDEGAIGWETTPAQLWPEQAAAMHPQFRSVTLRQLLSHEAGLAAFTNNLELLAVPAVDGNAREQRAAFVRWVLGRAPAGPAGGHIYSNGGYGVAAAMLEEATGEAWEDLVRIRIFEPLAMASCGFGWPKGAAGAPDGHRLRGGAYAAGPAGGGPPLHAAIAPGGDIHCSMADLGRFGAAHLLGLAGRHPLLRPGTFRTMHIRPGGEGYQLGWNVDAVGSQHRGGVTQGWHAVFFVSPSSQIVVAAAVNARAPGKTDELLLDATQLAFDLFRTRRGAGEGS